ncbi:MAG: glycosyltransferase [Myxococcota bacterium]
MPRFDVTIHTPEHLRNFSYVLAGLFDLEHRGVVATRVRLDARLHQRGQLTARCDVRDRMSGRSAVVLFDTKDSPDSILPVHWQTADVIFKRSFEPACVERVVPPEQRHKVMPMGLFLNARSRHEHHLYMFFAGMAAHALRNADWLGSGSLRRRVLSPINQDFVQRVIEYRTLPFVDEHVAPPPADTEPLVLFQTRAFPAYPADPPEFLASKSLVNAQRADLIRRLRAALGSRFVGGLVPDAFARRHFPDVLTTLPTDPGRYRELVRRARVVVYSAGLVGSAARKLAEYLAAGRAIVMQRLPTTLPAPLEDGRHALVFDDAEACVARCRELLDDAPRARALGEAAAAYYREWVEPATNVERMIGLAMAHRAPAR